MLKNGSVTVMQKADCWRTDISKAVFKSLQEVPEHSIYTRVLSGQVFIRP